MANEQTGFVKTGQTALDGIELEESLKALEKHVAKLELKKRPVQGPRNHFMPDCDVPDCDHPDCVNAYLGL